MKFDVRPVGDAAVMATLGQAVDTATVRRVWAITSALRLQLSAGVLDVVPAFASVLVRFDPLTVDLARVVAVVRGAVETCDASPSAASRQVRVGVCFDAQCGPDLAESAAALGMSLVQFRDAFCQAHYRVAFLGFIAGFPYLLGLPARLTLPRLKQARIRVPAGSVAISANQCGIYPRQSPGGWRLLGLTRAALFEPARDPAALFSIGDLVRFEPVERVEDAVAAFASEGR